MIWKTGNIWIWHQMGATIVIPTNYGWKSDGTNVMGRGLAKEAAEQFPDLPELYGESCQLSIPELHWPERRLILVPSKELNREAPWLSWQAPATIQRVQRSLEWLQANAGSFPNKVYVPCLGAGNGQLDDELIQELMDKILVDPKFIGVQQ